MRLTVGPLPPAVYWRRRAIVLGAVLLVLFVVAQACLSGAASPEEPAGGQPASDPPAGSGAGAGPTGPAASGGPDQPDAPATGSPAGEVPAGAPSDGRSPTAPAPTGPGACTDEEMRITAEADRTSFQVGTRVQFTIRIRNDSDRTCRRDIGGDRRELYLRRGTGAAKVWSSRDCGGPAGSEVRELAPGFETSHWTVWDGRASDACDGDEPAGEPVAPGEYQLVARLGTDYSEPLTITVR
jgi:hypothetical protein